MTETVSTPLASGVLDRIRYRPSGYRPIEARIAAAVLENPDAFTRASVVEFAHKTAVSTGSVVRFAQVMGYDGFRDLKLAVARELPQRSSDHDSPREPTAPFTLRMDEQIRALKFAASTVDSGAVSRAARRLAAARHVEIVAIGASSSIAYSIQFALTIVGVHVRLLQDSGEYAGAAALLDRDDVLVAVSYSGRTRAIVDAAAMAREGGASVVSLTCNPRSALLDHTDVAILVDAKKAGAGASEWPLRTALHSVARALTLEVVNELPADELQRRRARWSSGRFGLRYDDR